MMTGAKNTSSGVTVLVALKDRNQGALLVISYQVKKEKKRAKFDEREI